MALTTRIIFYSHFLLYSCQCTFLERSNKNTGFVILNCTAENSLFFTFSLSDFYCFCLFYIMFTNSGMTMRIVHVFSCATPNCTALSLAFTLRRNFSISVLKYHQWGSQLMFSLVSWLQKNIFIFFYDTGSKGEKKAVSSFEQVKPE